MTPPRAGQHPGDIDEAAGTVPPALGEPVGAAPRPEVIVSVPATAGGRVGRDPPSPDRRVERRGAGRRDGVRDAGGDATAMTPADVDVIVRSQANGRSGAVVLLREQRVSFSRVGTWLRLEG
jgi:hypothetical protein